MDSQRIIACIVLYHPDRNVLSNIHSYFDYVDKLLVYDNSLSPNEHLFKEHKRYHDIEYYYLNGNQGIAVALNLACNRAISLGFTWILTMDQDSSFNGERFFQVFFNQADKEETAIYAPVHVDEAVPDASVEDVMFAMTSGNLLNLVIYSKIGGFEEGLFIDEVDHDYCLKAKIGGYKIKKIKVAINHSVGKHREVRFLGRHEIFFIHSPIRLYYIVRNNLYIFSKYVDVFPELVLHRKKMLRKTLIGNLIFDLIHIPSKLHYMYRGMKDYQKKKFGKYSR